MCLCAHYYYYYLIHTAGASLPTTTLRVAEVTQNSVRLGWTPLAGATGYILRWRDETGETLLNITVCFIADINMPALQSRDYNFTFLRHWPRPVRYTPCFVQHLPGDWASFGPSIPLYRTAHL